MPTYTIAGKTVLITGAAGGIGAAAARALQARGANVVLADLGPGAASALARELGGDRALALTVDVTDTAALADAVDRTVDRFGSLDIVFANAGIAADPPATIATIDEATFERVVEVDLLGVWRTVRAALPHVIAARGHVLVTASVYAYVNGMANAPYAVQRPASNSSAGPCAPNSPSTAPPPGCSTPAGSAHPSPGQPSEATTPPPACARSPIRPCSARPSPPRASPKPSPAASRTAHPASSSPAGGSRFRPCEASSTPSPTSSPNTTPSCAGSCACSRNPPERPTYPRRPAHPGRPP
jgi:short chain dehydrogenase